MNTRQILRIPSKNIRGLIRLLATSLLCKLIIIITTQTYAQSQETQSNALQAKQLEANYYLSKLFEEKAKTNWEKSWQLNDAESYKESSLFGEPTDAQMHKKAWLFALEAEQYELPTGRVGLTTPTLEALTRVDSPDFFRELYHFPSYETAEISSLGVGVLAVSPDAELFAVSAFYESIQVWDAQTGSLLQTLENSKTRIHSLAFSPDGRTLASSDYDKTIRLWDLATGKTIKILKSEHLQETEAVSLLSDDFSALAFSPDGQSLALGSPAGFIQIWQVNSDEPPRTFKAYEDAVLALAFHPQGERLATISGDGVLKLWQPESGKPIPQTNEQAISSNALAYSPDGKWLVLGGINGAVNILDSDSGELLQTLEGGSELQDAKLNRIQFSLDGKTLVAGTKRLHLRIWDTQDWGLKHTFTEHSANNALAPFWDISSGAWGLSRENKLLVFTSESITQYELNSGYALLQEGYTQGDTLTYSSDGTQLATTTAGGNVQIWDAKTGKRLKRLAEFCGLDLAYSPDSKQLASVISANYFGGEDTLCLRNIETGELTQITLENLPNPRYLAYHPKGEMLAIGSDSGNILLLDSDSGQPLKRLKGHTNRVNEPSFSPNGTYLASVSEDQTIRLWDVNTGELLKTLQGHSKEVNAVAFTPDSSVLASASEDQTIRLWNSATGQPLHLLTGHFDNIRALAFSPDGKVLASGSADRSIRLWDSTNGEIMHILKGHQESVWGLSWHPGGKVLASISLDNTMRLWDMHGLTAKPKRFKGHTERLTDLRYSPDGKILASAAHEQQVHLWSNKTGEKLHTLQGHKDSINQLAFTPDSKIIATAADDQTIKLWRVEDGKLLHTLKGHDRKQDGAEDDDLNPVYTIAFSPNGKVLASGGDDNIIHLWRSDNGELIKTITVKPAEDAEPDVSQALSALQFHPNG